MVGMSELFTERSRAHLQMALGPGFALFASSLDQTVQETIWSTGITMGRPHPQATSSVLLECTTPAGQPALLRVVPDASLALRESAGLGVWSPRGLAPQVISTSGSRGALVMERIEGQSLAEELFSSGETERVGALLHRLHGAPVPDQLGVPALENFLLERLHGAMGALPHFPDVPVTREDLSQSVELLERLGTSRHERVLLHGDLSPERILTTPSRQLQVVAPKPLVGDPAFDVATYAVNRDPVTAPLTAHTLGNFLQLDPGRVQSWLRIIGPDMALLGRVYSQGTPREWAAMAALAHGR